MAISTAPRPDAAGRPPGDGPSYMLARDRPVGGFELWSWLFMRISGVVLLVLAVGHTLIMHVLDDGVDRVNASFIAERWGSPFWRAWDWALLVLALIHGVNGLRVITLDYVRLPGVRFALNMFFSTLGFLLFVLGTVIVFTFDPSTWPRTA